MDICLKIIEFLRGFNTVSIVVRLFLAVLLGGMVGIERSKSGRAAGLRTHILVCLGSAVASMVGLYINLIYGDVGDISRIAAQVVSGIGFLGAGTILVKNQETVTGLTTAACVWAVGMLGLSIGYGFYEVALLGSLLIVLITHTLGSLDKKLRRNMKEVSLYIEVIDAKKVNDTIELIKKLGCEFTNVTIVSAKTHLVNGIGVDLAVQINRKKNEDELIKQINCLENVYLAINTYV